MMDRGARLQAGKPLVPFGAALSDPCAALGASSQSRMPDRDKPTMLRSPVAANSHGSAAARPWARFVKAVEGWRLRRRLRAQLYALSDDMLKDIGVSRWEIEWIVSSPSQDPLDRAVKSCR